MKKKKKKQVFVPFAHDNLEVKNELIKLAREMQGKNGLENQLGSALIYASFSEYIGEHLLENLRYLVYQTTFVQYAGILFIDEREDNEIRTMGKTIAKLRDYGFPDKEEIIKLLSSISISRNNLFHNLAKADADGLRSLDGDIKEVQALSEELVNKINVVYAGLQKILVPQGAADKVQEQS